MDIAFVFFIDLFQAVELLFFYHHYLRALHFVNRLEGVLVVVTLHAQRLLLFASPICRLVRLGKLLLQLLHVNCRQIKLFVQFLLHQNLA